MRGDLIQRLVAIGFSEREARVYLALLEGGGLTASHVFQRTGLKRTTILAVCENLAHKGLIMIMRGKGATKFFAQAPEHVTRLVHAQRQELEARHELAQAIVPELCTRYRPQGDRPYVWSGEGEDAEMYQKEAQAALSGTELRLPHMLFPVRGDMVVCDDMVCLYTHCAQRYTVIIRSQEIADVCRAVLLLAQKHGQATHISQILNKK